MHQRLRFHLLPFEGPGLYWFQVEVKKGEAWDSVARLPLEVTIGASREAVTTAAE